MTLVLCKAACSVSNSISRNLFEFAADVALLRNSSTGTLVSLVLVSVDCVQDVSCKLGISELDYAAFLKMLYYLSQLDAFTT